jgi:pimeloyl-ACP methyl ester carboxylesterase
MSEMLRALIEKEVTRNNGSGPKAVTLISHDWGAFLTYQFTKSYPEMVEAIVSLDVGMGACAVDPFDVTNLLVIFAYQSYLIICFIVSQLLPFGSFFGDIMLGLYPWKWIGPTPHEYKVPRPLNEIKSWMAYPYFQLVKEKLCTLGASPGVANPMHFGKPLLYLYGPRKRAFFHTKAFLKDIDELASSAADQPGAVIAASQWHAISGCGHWMHTQAPDIVAKHISTFFLAIKDMQGPGSSRLKRT